MSQRTMIIWKYFIKELNFRNEKFKFWMIGQIEFERVNENMKRLDEEFHIFKNGM